jgi:hypothetical protein
MEIKVKLRHHGHQLYYQLSPLSRTIYKARLLNADYSSLPGLNNIEIYMTGMVWGSNCDDLLLVKELSTAIKTILN